MANQRLAQRRYAAFALAASAVLAASACAKTTTSAASADNSSGPIHVGSLLSLKGAYGAVGVPESNALQMGVEEINKAGGIQGRKVVLNSYDDEGNQATAGQLAHRLAESDKVQAVIGPGITALATVAAPVFEKDKVLDIALTAQKSLWQGKTYIWSAVPSDELMADAMLKYATSAGAKKVAIGYSGVQYGVGGNELLLASLKNAGIQPLADEKWSDTDVSFAPVVSRLTGEKPDAILLWGSGAPADAQMVQALRQSGYQGQIIGNTAYVNQQLLSVAGTAAEKFVGVSLIQWGDPQGETKKFIDAYTSRYGKKPTAQAAYAYDAIYRYAAAVKKAKSTDPKRVADAMAAGLNVTSVQGTFHITVDDHVGASSPDIYHAVTVSGGAWAPAS